MADHSTDEGYTMLELVTVMCIMLVLGAIATVSSTVYLNHARNTALKSDVNYAGKAISAYLGMYGSEDKINVSVSGEQLKLVNAKGDVLTQKVSAKDTYRILDTAFVQDMSAWCIGMSEKRTGKAFYVQVDSGALSEPREGSCSSVGYDATAALAATPTSTSTPTPTPTDTGSVGGGGATSTAPTSTTTTTTAPPTTTTTTAPTTTTTTTPPVTTTTTTTPPVTTTTTTTPPVTTTTTTTPPVTTTTTTSTPTTTTPTLTGDQALIAANPNRRTYNVDKSEQQDNVISVSYYYRDQMRNRNCNRWVTDPRVPDGQNDQRCISWRAETYSGYTVTLWVPSPWTPDTDQYGGHYTVSPNQAYGRKFVW